MRLLTDKLKPCPICGKMPIIDCDIGYDTIGMGASCVIQCKPLLRKPHKIVRIQRLWWNEAYDDAIKEWNTRAEDGIKELSVLRKETTNTNSLYKS